MHRKENPSVSFSLCSSAKFDKHAYILCENNFVKSVVCKTQYFLTVLSTQCEDDGDFFRISDVMSTRRRRMPRAGEKRRCKRNLPNGAEVKHCFVRWTRRENSQNKSHSTNPKVAFLASSNVFSNARKQLFFPENTTLYSYPLFAKQSERPTL